jgi:cardiolipin synthase (CMP-forming)
MTIPNLLTFCRILLTPLLVWFLLNNELNQALVVFFIAGMTDGLDGLIARLFHQKSKLGAYLDPLADKLLLVSSFILLGYIGLAPVWLVIITISRDVMIVLGLVTLVFHQVQVVIKPILLSKIATFMQLLTVLAVLASSLVALPEWAYTTLFVSTAALCIASGVHYFVIGISLLDLHRNSNNIEH